MRPTLPAAFEQAIAKPRLDSYRGYFRASLDEAVGMYMWNMELSSCMSALLCHFEIALRNNVHRAMSQFYSRGASSSFTWYDSIRRQLPLHLQDKILKIRQQHTSPGPDEIVSRLTFGFWPSLIGKIDIRFTAAILPVIFPHHPLNATPSDWRNQILRKAALAYLSEFNTMRNRLAHHEPIWKFAAVADPATAPGHRLLGTVDLASSLARFHRFLTQYDTAMAATNSDLASDVACSSWRKRIDFLLSPQGVERYRQRKHVTDARISPAQLRRNFAHVVQQNQPVVVGGSGRIRGVFLPGG